MAKAGNVSLSELFGSVETDADLEAAEALLDEIEQKKAAESRPASKWVATSLQEIADLFSVSLQAVKQWRIEDPPMPGEGRQGRPGRYDIKEVIAWRWNKVRPANTTAERLRQQDIELGEIKIERQRLELAKEKGELLDRADVERWAAVTFVTLRESCMAIPEAIATSAPFAIRALAREEADRVIRGALTATRRRLDMQSLDAELSIDNNQERADSE